jgi:hypothetical protein
MASTLETTYEQFLHIKLNGPYELSLIIKLTHRGNVGDGNCLRKLDSGYEVHMSFSFPFFLYFWLLTSYVSVGHISF